MSHRQHSFQGLYNQFITGAFMEHEFWHQRWQQNQIGFHQGDINLHLRQQWSKLEVVPNSRVLVPMCGKSSDMLWLLDQGYRVVGIELSPLAVAAFFSENDLQPTLRQQGEFIAYEIDELAIFCGDFFTLRSVDIGRIDAVYDRAALVALPAKMRLDYAAHMATLLEPNVKILLETFDYLQQEMSGPPFSVPHDEVEKLFHDWCDIELLVSEQILKREVKFKDRGLSQLQEHVYRLVVRESAKKHHCTQRRFLDDAEK
ncbi:thiopurine S-methyltransferase [Methylomarinum sp. Ch1-1]|uniref:Thiopurine S-methyltransferase n=1 Tax=Methylomarinum roseum TaxID=3067653 RepID=A0AAU7NS23_9GAMM|nr:thiopurine S-methyltransferase [Methylomarinum sp. Ch1-1]MDP4520221.1 thiopurine S-methyltransferase [Methylomarinum sp. Ch1-1]